MLATTTLRLSTVEEQANMPTEQANADRTVDLSKGHSTETAILQIYNDIADAILNGQVPLPCLLDISVTFDAVDHEIIIRRLELTYGINHDVLSWLQDYLTERSQPVSWNSVMSALCQVHSGVLQGSVLGPFCSPSMLLT